mmetsp:Transcript_23662/g.42941  ORF Transcript_23662/g.42941 Transcript_23662/m.42941 type:complete len:720 (+) Transcript_23662:41-2200(+)
MNVDESMTRNHDSDRAAAQEVSFESDEEDDEYEYTYVDSDEDEENTHGQQPQLCGIKRNASPSFPLNDIATTSTFSPFSRGSKATCPHCLEESHFPVTDCRVVENWRRQVVSNGVLVLHAKLLTPAMKRRIRACALQLDIPQNQAAVRLCQNNWNIHVALESEEPPAARFQANDREQGLQHDEANDTMDAFHAAVAMVAENTNIVEGAVHEDSWDALSDAKPAANRDADQTGASVESVVPVEEDSAQPAPPPNALDSRDENGLRKARHGNNRIQDDNNNNEEDSKLVAMDQDLQETTSVAVEPHCQICLEFLATFAQEDLMSMSCGHQFCRKCCRQFVEHAFNNAILSDEYLQRTCPIPECNQVLTQVEIEQVAPHLLPEYHNQMLHSFVDGNRGTMRWCVGPDCKHQVAVACRRGLFPRGRNNNQGVYVATCGDCQTQFCFRCGQAPHDDYCEADREPMHVDRNRPVKNCPKCNIKIEKNGGCNHMHCKCGCHFCWICLEADTDYKHFCGRERRHGDEIARRRQAMRAIIDEPVNLDYIVNALQEERDADELDDELVAAAIAEKKEMEKRAHYVTRFVAHDEGQRFATNQCDLLLEGRAVDFAKASDLKSSTDTEFLVAANERLVAARRILKWSYCYVYYLLDEDENSMTSQKGLFQNHQERLERFTENLSDISERALLSNDDRAQIVNLISVIDHCMNIITDFEDYGAKYVAPKYSS